MRGSRVEHSAAGLRVGRRRRLAGISGPKKSAGLPPRRRSPGSAGAGMSCRRRRTRLVWCRSDRAGCCRCRRPCAGRSDRRTFGIRSTSGRRRPHVASAILICVEDEIEVGADEMHAGAARGGVGRPSAALPAGGGATAATGAVGAENTCLDHAVRVLVDGLDAERQAIDGRVDAEDRRRWRFRRRDRPPAAGRCPRTRPCRRTNSTCQV